MSHRLAVFAPLLGARSETFIRRHVQDLLPGETVVVAGETSSEYGNHWSADGPLLALNQLPPPHFTGRVFNAVAQRAGWKTNNGTNAKEHVTEFLQKHGARVAMGEFLSWSLPWLEVAQTLGVRFFGHGHGFDVSAHLLVPKWRAEYLKYEQSAGIIVVSQYSRLRLIELGLSPEKIHVVPCGVEVPPEPLERPEKHEVRCLVVGRMVSKKPPILNLDAFRRAAKACPALRLDYVGAGELLPAAHQFVRAFGLEDRVNLLGAQSPESVGSLLKNADIFMLHSMTDPETGDQEGLPVAVLEAMSHALPVVSSRHAGIPEAVSEGSTGLLVDEGDSRAMGERLVALARDGELRRNMGRTGWRVARERFTWDRERSDLLGLLGLDGRRTIPAVH